MALFVKQRYRFMEVWLFALLFLSVEAFDLIPLAGVLDPNACFGYSVFVLFILFTFYIRIPIWDIHKCMGPVIWWIIGVFLSFVSSKLFYEQNYYRSFLTNRHMLMIFAVPVLYSVRPTLKEIRRAFNGFSVMYLILTIMVSFVDPYLVAQSETTDFIQEGDYVHVLIGIRLIVIALILSLNESRKKLSVVNLAWVLFNFFVIFLVQNRTALIASVIIVFIAIRQTKDARSRLVGTFLGIVMAIVMLVYTAAQFDFLIQQTIEQLADPEYNRNKAWAYMFATREPARYFLGDGMISLYTSPLMKQLHEQGIYHSDVGIFGFWNQYGVITALTIFVLFCKGLAKKRGFVVNAISTFFLVGLPTLSYFGMYETIVPLSIYIYLYFVMLEDPKFDTMPPKYYYDVHGQRYRSIAG